MSMQTRLKDWETIVTSAGFLLKRLPLQHRSVRGDPNTWNPIKRLSQGISPFEEFPLHEALSLIVSAVAKAFTKPLEAEFFS